MTTNETGIVPPANGTNPTLTEAFARLRAAFPYCSIHIGMGVWEDGDDHVPRVQYDIWIEYGPNTYGAGTLEQALAAVLPATTTLETVQAHADEAAQLVKKVP